MRRGKGNGADVVAVDQRDEDRPDDQLDLERAEPVLVEKVRNLNFCAAAIVSPQEFLTWRFPAPSAESVGHRRVKKSGIRVAGRCPAGR